MSPLTSSPKQSFPLKAFGQCRTKTLWTDEQFEAYERSFLHPNTGIVVNLKRSDIAAYGQVPESELKRLFKEAELTFGRTRLFLHRRLGMRLFDQPSDQNDSAKWEKIGNALRIYNAILLEQPNYPKVTSRYWKLAHMVDSKLDNQLPVLAQAKRDQLCNQLARLDWESVLSNTYCSIVWNTCAIERVNPFRLNEIYQRLRNGTLLLDWPSKSTNHRQAVHAAAANNNAGTSAEQEEENKIDPKQIAMSNLCRAYAYIIDKVVKNIKAEQQANTVVDAGNAESEAESPTWIDWKMVCCMHKLIFENLDTEKGNTNTAGTIDPDKKEEACRLGDILKSINIILDGYARTKLVDPVALAAIGHFFVAWLHPFYDGNGRTARLVQDYILLACAYPPACIPDEGKQTNYFVYFQRAKRGLIKGCGPILVDLDIRPFIRYIFQCAMDTMEKIGNGDVLNEVNNDDRQLAPQELVVTTPTVPTHPVTTIAEAEEEFGPEVPRGTGQPESSIWSFNLSEPVQLQVDSPIQLQPPSSSQQSATNPTKFSGSDGSAQWQRKNLFSMSSAGSSNSSHQQNADISSLAQQQNQQQSANQTAALNAADDDDNDESDDDTITTGWAGLFKAALISKFGSKMFDYVRPDDDREFHRRHILYNCGSGIAASNGGDGENYASVIKQALINTFGPGIFNYKL